MVDRLVSGLTESAVHPEQNSRRARSARTGSVVNRGVFVERNARGGTVAHTINNHGCETCSARLSRPALDDIRAALQRLGPNAERMYCALLGVESLEDLKVSESRQAALGVTAVQMATEPLQPRQHS